MDFGEAKFIRSMRLKQQLLVLSSVKRVGYVYKFYKSKQSQYVCLSCKKLGKSRTVMVVDGALWEKKHPEDDHHEGCEPVKIFKYIKFCIRV